MMDKPRVAIFDFACCEGCQLQIVNLEEEILDLLNIIQPVEWREAISDQSENYDVAIVEGSITRPQDEDRLKEIRRRAKVLVALGACATTGGVNKLKNNFEMDEVRQCVYGPAGAMPHLATARTKAVHEVVKVDASIHGCPVSREELARTIRCLAAGTMPVTPTYPVCAECKLRETVCRYEYNEICLGVITRGGCNAPCPAGGMWCFGCRGLVDDPNVNAAQDVLTKYGRTVEELRSRMELFNQAEGQPCPRQ
jgi:coenzyme F420-reducing hydrogenase gamma subunit